MPISEIFPQLKAAISEHRQFVIEAPTGAGKSTALPAEMLKWQEISGKILMLEPRRVAARNVAHFVAASLGEPIGQTVGYRVRGETKVSSQTRLEVVTEGVLTRMIQQDPELTGIDVVMFDEIHERHLTTDMGLALALAVQQDWREDIKIIAMSATLSGLPLDKLMPDAVSLQSQGRSFEVELAYKAAPTQSPWLNHMAKVIADIARGESGYAEQYTQGSILAFLPGKGEIIRLSELLSHLPEDYLICPLYGELSAKQQQMAVNRAPEGKRKIVLATNVAESSLTIDGITIVVDSGYQREASFNPNNGVTRLSLKRISQASAIQRSGRAGRLQAGLAVRLWGAEQQGRLAATTAAEITQSELTQQALDCAYWGEAQLQDLQLLSMPPKVNEQLAWQTLQQLQLVDSHHKITALGRSAYELGVHPRLAFMLLKAKQIAADNPQLLQLACALAAIVEARGLPKKGVDIAKYLPLTEQGQVCQQVQSWLNRLQDKGQGKQTAPRQPVNSWASDADISLLLALAYPDRIAKARGQGRFLLSHGCGVSLDETEALANEDYLVVADFGEHANQQNGRVYLASRLPKSLFDGELAYLVTEQSLGEWNAAKGRFIAEKQTCIGKVVLARESINKIDQAIVINALLAEIRRQGFEIFDHVQKLKQLQLRVALARQFEGELWPEVSEQQLLASLEDWLAPYLNEVKTLEQLKKLDVASLLLNQLDWNLQQQLAEKVPSHWPMLTGTRAPIEYQVDDANQQTAAGVRALLKVRLQEALGMAQSPSLFNGKFVITMSLLSPAQRPIAVTADLASFWQGPYEHVKKEMKGKYPKHLWPDDPANTQPTKFTKKRTPGA
ncbi:ATP-dependent helicase HrpB [Shewanella sp. WXL01]|uniref:ATP-dependent helicase HrpB n=1 Tax=Shewanella sp. WXL01 TaxID=2709721 RepID=UPI0014382748|nr:ATP-dependent helicase HrpB [Shewanella sp. WXL01]NKF49547.1 ATP-dependent helicase HrpB [Shewanella sp. WXL01]